MLKKGVLVLCTFFPSRLRIAVWRMLGFKIGPNCRVAFLSVVVADRIEMERGSVIWTMSLIYAPKSFVMRERSRVSSFMRIIGYGDVLLEAQSSISLGCLIDCTGGFTLGARSQLGPRGTYYTHGSTGLLFNKRFPHRYDPIRIGADVWVGMSCIVYPGVTIGDGALVLPGVIVNRDVQANRAAIPPFPSFQVVDTEFFTDGVPPEALLRAMESFLRKLAAERSGSVDDSRSGYWTLTLPGDRRVVLIRDEAETEPAGLSAERGAVWRLTGRRAAGEVPTFHFTGMTILGRPTDFAESLAQFLCEDAGTHFVYERP